MDERKEFLTKVYEQMFNDIDRHHKIVWEIIGVLISAFAVLALIEKQIIPIDMATGIIILLACWVLAHVHDSNYWYNRNLAIITNIERQFLKQKDLKEIHYYFGKHRDKNSIQTSLKIQQYFCWAIIIIFMTYHFCRSIVPKIELELLGKIIPYAILLVGMYFVNRIKNKRIEDYEEFLQNSPGKEIDTTGETFDVGRSTP